jgi:dephospho-CoA kinase
VRRLLLTGLSGTGKSALVSALRARGEYAVDLDCAEYSRWVEVEADDEMTAAESRVEPGRDWVWREDAVRDLLAVERGERLFVSGCAANMGRFLPSFDEIVLLSAPPAVIAARLRERPRGEHGSRPKERERMLSLIDSVEPRLRRVAGHEIDTSGSVEHAVGAVLEIARTPSAQPGGQD